MVNMSIIHRLCGAEVQADARLHFIEPNALQILTATSESSELAEDHVIDPWPI